MIALSQGAQTHRLSRTGAPEEEGRTRYLGFGPHPRLLWGTPVSRGLLSPRAGVLVAGGARGESPRRGGAREPTPFRGTASVGRQPDAACARRRASGGPPWHLPCAVLRAQEGRR